MSVSVGRLAREKAGCAPLVGAIQIDTLHEEQCEMEIQIERTAKALEKRDRPRMDVARSGPRVTAWLT